MATSPMYSGGTTTSPFSAGSIPPIIQTAGTVYSDVEAATSNKNDEHRFAENQAAYNEAVAGDTDALAFLLARSRQNVTMFVNGYGTIGGWATQAAREDAARKYEAARAYLAQSGA